MKKGWKIAITIVGVALVVVLLRGCVATSYLIPSSGMENSLYQGERILVDKWSYGLRLPFMKLWGYHRWADSPVPKEDILVFNNPANLSEPTIDRREVFISRCIGTPGDTLLIDSLFSVIPSEKNAPDQKFLYSYPRQRERQLDSLLSILSIAPNKLLGQDSTKNIRSFSRYEHYLLEQAMNGKCWIEPIVKEDSMEMLKPLIIPSKGKAVRVEQDFVAKYPGTSRKETSRNQKRHPLCRRQTRATLPFYQRLLLGKCQQYHQSFGLPSFRFRPRRPHHRQGIYHLVLQRKGNRTFQRLPMGQDMEKSGMTNK